MWCGLGVQCGQRPEWGRQARLHLPVSVTSTDQADCYHDVTCAGGVTGVTRWSDVAGENASVTASVQTTRPALTTGARIHARVPTQAVALTPTAG